MVNTPKPPPPPTPVTASPASDCPQHPFSPIALRPRHDGWTTARQIAFVEALADCGCVDEACQRVGMSRASAYALRRHAASGSFREAWDAAIDSALHLLEDAAIGRAIHGVPRPIFYKGEQVGEWRQHDERMAMFLLRYRRQQRFGPWIDRIGAPDPDGDFDPAGRLDWHLGEIEELAPDDDGEEVPGEAVADDVGDDGDAGDGDAGNGDAAQSPDLPAR